MRYNIRLLDNYNSEQDRLERGTLEDFIEYNEKFYLDRWLPSSEAITYKLSAIKKWISIRDELTYTSDCDQYVGEWKYLDIADRHTKYGHCFIYIHPEKKLWRINATAAEFYGNRGERYE